MRKRNLLLTALFAAGLSAQAQGWEIAKPDATQYAPLAAGDTVYLYNVESQLFLNEGNDWGTHATMAETGQKVIVEQYLDPAISAWDGKTYLLKNQSALKGWKYLFIDADTVNVYVDRGSQENFYFEFEALEGNTYRIFGADLNPYANHSYKPTYYIGHNPNYYDNRNGVETGTGVIFGESTVTTPLYTTWAFISQESYAAYMRSIDTYNKALELQQTIIEAEEKGIDTAEAMATYENTESTLEELVAALDKLNLAISKLIEEGVSPDDPMDITEKYIVNATFEENYDGWQYDTGARNSQVLTNNLVDGEVFSGKFWENWSSGTYSGRMYKTVENLPNGVYRLSMGAFRYAGDRTFVYAGEDSVMVTSATPATYEVMTIVENNTLEVGLKTLEYSNGWMGIDNVKLIYYGNQLSSYLYWAEDFKNKYGEVTAQYYQMSLYEEFQKSLEAISAATDKDGVMAALDEARRIYTLLEENIAAWDAYCQLLEEGNEIRTDPTLSESEQKSKLAIYVARTASAILNEKALSTEEIILETEKLSAMIEEAIVNSLTVGHDVTGRFLTNADFTDGVNGWTIGYGSLKTGGASVNPNAESWQTSFNMYQQVANIPNGVYQFDFSGFTRSGDVATSWAERENPVEVAYAYVNRTEKALTDYSAGATTDASIYTSPEMPEEGYYAPNNLDEVARGFNAGLYKNTMYGIVTDGVLCVGIYSDYMSSHPNSWAAWDNFRLIYQGKDAGVLSTALKEFSAQAERLVQKQMSTIVLLALTDAMGKAETALNGTGEEMFDAYAALDAQIAEADTSITKYAELMTALLDLEANYAEFMATASDEALDNAQALLNDVLNGYNSGTYTDEEAENMIAEMEKAKTDLRTPIGVNEASDENPVEMTSRIINPTFINDNNEGWSGSGAAHGMKVQAAEFWNANFDFYQTITNLPNGTYKVSVDGFYRNGWATADEWKHYLDGTDEVQAFLYAASGTDTCSTPLIAVWDDIDNNSLGVNENTTIYDGKTVYSPNDMASAVTYFVNGQFNDNHVFINVEDGTLTIGLRKTVLHSEDWTMFDNFRLFYFGNASSKQESDNPMFIEKTPVDTTGGENVIYDLTGRRVKNPTRGLYIVNGRKMWVK